MKKPKQKQSKVRMIDVLHDSVTKPAKAKSSPPVQVRIARATWDSLKPGEHKVYLSNGMELTGIHETSIKPLYSGIEVTFKINIENSATRPNGQKK